MRKPILLLLALEVLLGWLPEVDSFQWALDALPFVTEPIQHHQFLKIWEIYIEARAQKALGVKQPKKEKPLRESAVAF
jgi:hypothetical protein